MTLNSNDNVVSLTGDFPTGSAGEIRRIDDRSYEILPKPEPVPDWFFEALQVNFGGAGVPREYAFHIRVTATEFTAVELKFQFTETNGAGYMDPPYWIQRAGSWRSVPEDRVAFVSRSHCVIRVDVGPDESVSVANKPYLSLSEIDRRTDEIVRCHEGWSVCEMGRTEEGRSIVALESEPRDETIFIHATMQPAEPASEPILAIAHALSDSSRVSNRLRERFQFCLIPLPNPDGSYHGRSVTNAKGEVPMFSFGRFLSGESAPVETQVFWEYAARVRPTGFIEFHTHYQGSRRHKLNPVSIDWFEEAVHRRVGETTERLLQMNEAWRLTELTPETPIVTAGKFVNMAKELGTIPYCYQIYSPTIEATCSQAIAATQALAFGLAGQEWEHEAFEPDITPG